MGNLISQRLRQLKEEIRQLLCNQLTYPKTVLSLLRSRDLSEEHLLKMQTTLDETIQRVDSTFLEFIDQLEKEKSFPGGK